MPIPRGGARAIPDALRRLIEAYNGLVLTEQRVERIVVRNGRAMAVRTGTEEFPARRAVLATVEPQQLFLDLAGAGALPADFVKLVRRFRRGSGVFKLDLALSGPPQFRSEVLRGTLVLHLARSVGELSRGVAATRRGALPSHPLLIAGLHTLADPSRAPAGCHTLWAETHVPSRIEADVAESITARRWSEALTVTISKRNERTFIAAGIEPRRLESRIVRVRGFIEERNGPRIEAIRPEQIEIADRN